MTHDALKDALSMHRGSKVFQFLMDQRMYDVVECHKHEEAIAQFNKEKEDNSE